MAIVDILIRWKTELGEIVELNGLDVLNHTQLQDLREEFDQRVEKRLKDLET